MFDFSDRVVIVTGAAGNLGVAIARAFQEARAKLVLVDRAADRLARIFPEIVDSPDHFLATSVDLTDPDGVGAMAEQTIQRFGRIDVLANVAGGFRSGTAVHETPFETWDFMLNLNAGSVFIISRAVIPYMLEQGEGKVISVAARAALQGSAKMAAYSVSKEAFTQIALHPG